MRDIVIRWLSAAQGWYASSRLLLQIVLVASASAKLNLSALSVIMALVLVLLKSPTDSDLYWELSWLYWQLTLFCFQVSLIIRLFLSYILLYHVQQFNYFCFYPTELSPLAHFFVQKYIFWYEDYIDSRRPASIPINNKHRFVYDLRFRINWVTAVGAWMKRWAHWGGCNAVLHIASLAVLLDMLFICCTEELLYLSRFAAIMVRYVNLCDETFSTDSLHYLPLLCSSHWHHLLANCKYWLKETEFERRVRLRLADSLFDRWQFVDVFDTPPVRRRELFDKVLEWLEC